MTMSAEMGGARFDGYEVPQRTKEEPGHFEKLVHDYGQCHNELTGLLMELDEIRDRLLGQSPQADGSDKSSPPAPSYGGQLSDLYTCNRRFEEQLAHLRRTLTHLRKI